VTSANSPPPTAEATICACATTVGGRRALLRLSGDDAFALAARAGLPVPDPWRWREADWRGMPCRVFAAKAPRTFTGCDLVEITVPGSRAAVAAALADLRRAGAGAAGPGAFARQALARGRLDLDRAAAVLRVAEAGDGDAARRAVASLRGELGRDCDAVREHLIETRALLEAGLDFVDEEDVAPLPPSELRERCAGFAARLERWRRAATPRRPGGALCLVGAANAGKSVLFHRLTGEPALIADRPGTTRDWLEGTWHCAGREVAVVDTAGWLDAAAGDRDRVAVAAGQRRLAGALLVVACHAPDAPLPGDWRRRCGETPSLVVQTKADVRAPRHPDAVLEVAALHDRGLDRFEAVVADRLVARGDDVEPRQQECITAALAAIGRARTAADAPELAAEDLRQAAEHLGELTGATTPDDVLDAIFARFCIGK